MTKPRIYKLCAEWWAVFTPYKQGFGRTVKAAWEDYCAAQGSTMPCYRLDEPIPVAKLERKT